MKNFFVIPAMFFFLFIVSPPARTEGPASPQDVQALKQAFDQLRADYEAEIRSLRAKVERLESAQIPQPPRSVDSQAAAGDEGTEKTDGLEYVGRYEGPFQKGGLVYRNPSGFGNVSIGGYADIEFENFQNTNSTFDQHRWIINIGAELAEVLRFYSEYEIEHGGSEAHVEQAWMDYLITDWFNLRAGALLVPFGRYNLYHDSDLQDLTDRPILSRRVIPTTWTEAGAGFYGEFNPKIGSYEDLTIAYETYVMNGLSDNFSDTSLRNARGSLEADNNNSKSWAGRVVLSPKLGHEIAVSSYLGKFNQQNDLIKGIALDGLTTWGPLEVLGEYAFFDIDEPAGAVDRPERATGFYVQANYHFWPEFLNRTFLGSRFDNPAFTLAGRFGWAGIADDLDVTTGENREQRFTFGLNYRPVESWVLKLEYQLNSNNDENLERGNNDGFIGSVAIGF